MSRVLVLISNFLGRGLLVHLSHIFPVHQIIDKRFQIFRTRIAIVDVVGVLPHVAGQQRGLACLGDRRAGIGRRHALEAAVRVLHEPAPAAAEGGHRRLRELLLERVERAEVLSDRRREIPVGFAAAVGREVRPVDGVEHVAGDVEGERLLEADDRSEVTGRSGLVQLVECRVGAGNVGGVMLGVMELDDLRADGRLEVCVVVGEVGELVGRHGVACSHPLRCRRARHDVSRPVGLSRFF